MRSMSNWSMFRNSRQRKGAQAQQAATHAKRTRLMYESLENRSMMAVASFTEGVGGYTGTQDTVLFSKEPSVNFGTETGISVDQQDAGGVRQGLLRYDGIFGTGAGQIPFGSTINSATLTVSVFNDSNASMQMSLYRMNVNWDQNVATWNSFGSIGGVNASENEVQGLPPDAILFDSTTGVKVFNVKTSLEHWVTGETNFGWLIESAATNGWDFDTSEATLANRPVLTVDYTPPSGAGSFKFLTTNSLHPEGNTGTSTAIVDVARIGGTTGTVTVDYTITAGTATGGSDFVLGNGQLTFNDGVATQPISITVNGDTTLEGLETVNITLSNPQNGSSISGANATLSIADDDALISEVLANVTNAGSDETNREYIELLGTPGASLNGYYFVVFEGEEEENGGSGSGRADFVLDLSGQFFGSNGILVITPTAWSYTPDPASSVFATAALNGVGGVLEDSSQTYALIRSPINPIVQGTDYDTVGAYANTTATADGPGVGILDQLPVGAEIMDSVFVVEGGGGDRDRAATLQHPGIHVHQPNGLGSSNTTSDVVTRRFDERDPNSIGVWYNGDIPNGATGVYAAPSATETYSSVVTPAGAQITPGALNILRTIGFSVSAISVDEAAGIVSLTITRAGDLSQAISVNYATSGGTATSNVDFTAESGPINFGIGDSSETIDIAILPDMIAEGFESFTVTLSSVTSPFQIVVPTVTVTIVDANVSVQTFQDGVNGYNSTDDVTLNSIQPNDSFGGTTAVSIDEEVGALTGQDSRPAQGLLKFGNLFGNAINQVPAGSQIFSAFLTLNVNNPSTPTSQIRLFQMLKDWDESTATFSDPQGNLGSDIVNGVTPDDVEATADISSVVPTPGVAGLVQIPLDTDLVQAWANNTLPNYGWAIINDGGNDWNFNSSDSFDAALLPKLTILYTAPTGQGTFSFSDADYKVNENGTASIKVHREGGSAGTVTINYQITDGTGSATTDITGSASGSLTFSPGELFETITIPINNDSTLERNETLNLSISGGGATYARNAAVLTIRDNDFNTANPTLLLNEFFINSPGNDGTHEFAELTGLAGAGLGSLYFVVIDGDVGPAEGSGDLVVDIGTFVNGANGQTVIGAGTNFDFSLPSDATFIGRPELNVEALANDTATYALMFSPSSSLTTTSFDYDWDNDGTLELPAGTVFIDSVTVRDTGASDRAYGPGGAGSVIDALLNPNLYVADAISRFRGNTTANTASAWFHGDLVPNGDDPAKYNVPNAVGLPAPGAALTPGEINTGTPVQSPLVSLLSVVPNAPVGTVTLTFNGPVSQVLDPSGLNGISITQPNGQPFPQVDVIPQISGLFTNTLTLSFTGIGVSGGLLPSGNFRLNFVGDSLIGNGRAVDAANNGTTTGSNAFFDFTVNNAPAAPTGLTATATAANKISLAWSDNATNETGYRVERSTGGPFTTIATLPANTTSYVNTQVQSYINYTYRVVATGAVDSAPSNTDVESTVLEVITGTANADTYRVRRVGTLLEVYENTVPGVGVTPDYSAELAAMTTGLLTINTLGGNDALLVNTNGNATLGLNRIAYNPGGDTNTLELTAGEARVDSNATGGILDTTVLGGATLVTSGIRQRGLNLAGASAIAEILPNGGATGLVVLDSLTVANDAVLDLNDNDLVLTYDPLGPNPLTTITGYVDNSYSSGAVPGSGLPVIGSTTVDSSGGSRVIIPVDNANSQFGDVGNPFYDLTLGNSTLGTGFNQIVVRFTYPGDYNLDGQVDGADYTVVDSNLGTPTPGLSGGWTLGDGDFSGFIEPADYLPIDSNFGSGVGNPLTAATVTALFAEEQDWRLEQVRAGSAWEQAIANVGGKTKKTAAHAAAEIFGSDWK
ncbi:MAG: Calx-beta domain-containing protein [Pirellulales bacterium]|nr:Calx-beta domain-containing protein [Pirellulales bacterium]